MLITLRTSVTLSSPLCVHDLLHATIPSRSIDHSGCLLSSRSLGLLYLRLPLLFRLSRRTPSSPTRLSSRSILRVLSRTRDMPTGLTRPTATTMSPTRNPLLSTGRTTSTTSASSSLALSERALRRRIRSSLDRSSNTSPPAKTTSPLA